MTKSLQKAYQEGHAAVARAEIADKIRRAIKEGKHPRYIQKLQAKLKKLA